MNSREEMSYLDSQTLSISSFTISQSSPLNAMNNGDISAPSKASYTKDGV